MLQPLTTRAMINPFIAAGLTHEALRIATSGNVPPEHERTMKIKMVSSIVFETPLKNAYAKTRKREIVVLRQVIMTLLIFMERKTTTLAGAEFGKDHATAIHSRNTIKNLYQTNKRFMAKMDDIILQTANDEYERAVVMGKLRGEEDL